MPGIRETSFAITLLGIAACLWLVPAPRAFGGQRICEHKGLSSRDAEQVRRIASETLQGHVVDWKSLRACTNPRKEYAWADVDAVVEPLPDGSVRHHAAWCLRDGREWKCDLASGRTYDFAVKVAGRDRVAPLMVPDELDLAVAQRVLQAAIDRAPSLGPEHACGGEKPESPLQIAWVTNAVEEIHRDFEFGDDHPPARIEGDSHALSVEVGVHSLDFVPASPGDTGYRFDCWSPLIIMQ